MKHVGFLSLVFALALPFSLQVRAEGPAVEVTPEFYRVVINEKIEAARDLLVSGLQGRNYAIINQLDVQEGLAGRNIVSGPLRLVEFCNLSRAYRITRSNRGFEMFAPCRMALFEEEGRTIVMVQRPLHVESVLMKEGLSAEAKQILHDFDADIRAILESAATGDF